MNVKNMLTTAINFVDKNSPTILIGCATSGVIATTGFAIKGTIKSVRAIDEEKINRRLRDDDQNILTKKEKVKLCWKYYIPTAISAGVTITALIAAHTISSKRAAVLASMYSMSEAALKEYQNKVIDVIGENKETKISDEIAKDKVKNNPIKDENIIKTTHGDQLFLDALSGRYFMSDIEYIRQCQNDINESILRSGLNSFETLNSFYYLLGLDDIELGADIGWSSENKLNIRFTATIPEGKKEPVIVLQYSNKPKMDYPF